MFPLMSLLTGANAVDPSLSTMDGLMNVPQNECTCTNKMYY